VILGTILHEALSAPPHMIQSKMPIVLMRADDSNGPMRQRESVTPLKPEYYERP